MTELPDPWETLDPDRADALTAELAREIHHTHPLYGLEARAIAARTDQDWDDYLFEVAGNGFSHCVIHLTWSVETGPDWPKYTSYTDLEDLAQRFEY